HPTRWHRAAGGALGRFGQVVHRHDRVFGGDHREADAELGDRHFDHRAVRAVGQFDFAFFERFEERVLDELFAFVVRENQVRFARVRIVEVVTLELDHPAWTTHTGGRTFGRSGSCTSGGRLGWWPARTFHAWSRRRS